MDPIMNPITEHKVLWLDKIILQPPIQNPIKDPFKDPIKVPIKDPIKDPIRAL